MKFSCILCITFNNIYFEALSDELLEATLRNAQNDMSTVYILIVTSNQERGLLMIYFIITFSEPPIPG